MYFFADSEQLGKEQTSINDRWVYHIFVFQPAICQTIAVSVIEFKASFPKNICEQG